MVAEIRIYVEGGGKGSLPLIRKGFSEFLSSIRDLARSRRIGWTIVPCGPRSATEVVRQRARHCDRLFQTLEDLLAG